MILCQTEDNAVHSIDSWGTFRPKTPVKKLMITDGKSLYKELFGYDGYWINKEGVAGERTRRTVLVRESIFGIRYLDDLKEELTKHYNSNISIIIQKNPKQDIAKEKMEKCTNRYKRMLGIIEDREVVCHSIITETKMMPLEKSEVIISQVKKGNGVRLDIRKLLGRFYYKRLNV